MPKITKELTALEVKHLGYGTFSIGGVKGLYIRKTPHQQFFFLRYKDESGRHDYALGNYPEVSVAQARKAAADARASIAKGTNPIDERQSERAARLAAKQAAQAELEQKKQTFEKIANEWVEDRVNHGYWSKNHRGEKDTRQILSRHLFPIIGAKNIDQITPEDIRECLSPIWQSAPSTAKKARTHARKIFQWAIAFHKRKNRENPADMAWNGSA